ncbi:DUF4037 domain-containing protein [Sneathia sanguinegens]|uniref:DUF4037 domain-containing protein n=2 Tax=Sneathia sanguinegens TaxID=40543 RepID=A0ABT7HJ46_9FUSO|nr:DUF4037 domain-containing protein [Sneathia sanguinegens]
MKGMELVKENFFNNTLPILREYDIKISAGLVGYGSECYGFDDEYSKDHDFSKQACIWLKKEDYEKYGKEINERILDEHYKKTKTVWSNDRRGVLDIDEFIFTFLGTTRGPKTDEDFLNIPEYLLSSFTNGEIFIDELGIITEVRKKVEFYPRDIRYNRIATRCMNASREGLYNYERCLKRNEMVACNQALSKFIEETIELYYLIYKKYCPYYKWYHRMLKTFDEKAANFYDRLVDSKTSSQEKLNIISMICSDIIDKLEKEEIIIRVSDYLGYYGPIIQSRIDNDIIRDLGFWSD